MVKFGVLDKAFAKIEKQKVPLGILACLALILAFVYQRDIREFIQPHEPFFKLLALVLAPLATVLGFYLGYRSKKELINHSVGSENKLVKISKDLSNKSNEVGKLEAQLDASRLDLEKSQAAFVAQQQELAVEGARVRRLDANLRRVTDGGHQLWKAYPPRPFTQYYEWLRAPQGAKIITIGNLKGGVGKTTIAANFAAYVSKHREKPVLLIDLDYQGSLSNMMMFAAGIEEIPSNVNKLFEQDSTLETLAEASVHLAKVLPRGWIVPASYTLGSVEGKILLNWLMDPDEKIDARYILARILLNPSVRQRYSIIILDMPPRLTLGAVSALVASHHLIVPSALDKMSAEAVSQFLQVAHAIKSDLGLDLDLLGTIGTLSRNSKLNATEDLNWSRIGEYCQKLWGADREFRLARTIPRKTKIAEAAGEAVAYLSPGNQGNEIREIFDALGDEIWDRLFGRPGNELPSPQSELLPAMISAHESV